MSVVDFQSIISGILFARVSQKISQRVFWCEFKLLMVRACSAGRQNSNDCEEFCDDQSLSFSFCLFVLLDDEWKHWKIKQMILWSVVESPNEVHFIGPISLYKCFKLSSLVLELLQQWLRKICKGCAAEELFSTDTEMLNPYHVRAVSINY